MKTYQPKRYKIQAEPITKLAYCQLRGWDVPVDEDPELVGYLVHVFDRPANTKAFDHFVRWQDKADFDARHEEVKPDNYFTRLVEEQGQNKERLDKLSVFLDQQSKMSTPTIAYEPLRLLFLQQTLMSELDKVLVERIRLAEVEMEK